MNQLIHDLLAEIREDVKQIRETQLLQGFDIKENKESLMEHMRRTELAETRIEKTEDRLDKIERDVETKKYSWKLIGAICAGITGVVSFGYTVYRFIIELF